jgi:hypothetical protein
MPRGDTTGPFGAGPMTGRGAGFCAGYSLPGYMNPIGGYGRGWGRGRGRGFGRGWGRGRILYPQPIAVQSDYLPVRQPQSTRQELAELENYQLGLEAQKSDLEQEMEGVKARIEELKEKIEKLE